MRAMALYLLRAILVALAFAVPQIATAQGSLPLFQVSAEDPSRLSLKGEWGFIWGEHLSPIGAYNAVQDGSFEAVHMPGRWQEFLPKDPENPHYHGLATYVANVDVPHTAEPLVLALSTVSEAYRIYWVPASAPHAYQLVAEAGNLEGPAQAGVRNQSHEFLGRGAGLLVMHVRKDVFGWSGINSWNGIRHKPEIVARDINTKERINHELILGIVTGIILFTMAQNFLLYALNKEDQAPLYLAIGCLLVAMRALILWDKVELWFGPEWFVLRMRLEMLNIVVASSFLMGLNRSLLPSYYPNWAMRSVIILVAGQSTFILFAPADIMSSALPVYQAFSLFVCAISFWGISRAIVHREEGALIACIALSFLVFGAAHDIVSVILRDYEVLLVEYAFVAMMVIYTFLIGQRFAQSQQRATSLLAEQASLKQMHTDAVNSARRDHLTGLLNRKAFDQELDQAVEEVTRTHTALSLVIFDIDHFKACNDTHGHQVGDIVLKTLGAKLSGAPMRGNDCICRYGGEEFAVILPHTSEKEAAQIAERLRKEISAMYVNADDGLALRITCSFGVANAEGNKARVVSLLRAADSALYEAKRNGRNRVHCHSGETVSHSVA